MSRSISRSIFTFPLTTDEILALKKARVVTIKDFQLRQLDALKLQALTNLSEKSVAKIMSYVTGKPSHEHKTSMSFLKAQFIGSKKRKSISSKLSKLDRGLGGGFSLGRVYEVYGEAGSGKSQFCMQMCLNSQRPFDDGGMKCKALYIDCEGNFCMRRLRQLSQGSTNEQNLYYVRCGSYEEFKCMMLHKLEPFLSRNKEVKLVVIDSISYYFRYGFEGTWQSRYDAMRLVSSLLYKIAMRYNTCILAVNQVSGNVEAACDQASLGKSWAHTASSKILLKRSAEGSRIGMVEKSIIAGSTVFNYEITDTGIRDFVTAEENMSP